MSFAGSSYRVGNRYVGQVVGVRLVADTVQITQDGLLLRTHRARHDKGKEFAPNHTNTVRLVTSGVPNLKVWFTTWYAAPTECHEQYASRSVL